MGASAQAPQGQAPQTHESWATSTSLPGVDLTPLSAAQKQKALQVLREQACPCGCGFKVAECRIKDPGCGFSSGLAGIVAKGIKDGKSVDEIAKLESASRWGHAPEPPKLLEDPVQISLEGAPSQGPKEARITLVEFSDFECPYCSQAANEVWAVLQAYPTQMRLVYKQFPLESHPHANLAAVASLAALNQNKFWPMHDKLFGNYRKLSRENILAWAQELGLDMPRFTADLVSPKLKSAVQKDVAAGEEAGVTGTPSFYINGKHYNGAFSLAALKPIFDAELGTTKAPSSAK